MTRIPRETLRAVFIREKPYHLAWPMTFDDALADPLTLALLETIARHVPAYTRERADRARMGIGPTLTTPERPPAPVRRLSGGPVMVDLIGGPVMVDRKRLAGGDRDD